MEKNKISKKASVFVIIALICVPVGSVIAWMPSDSIQTTSNAPSKAVFGAPNLTVENFKGGFGISVVVKNVGNATATNINWSMDLTGNMIFFGAHSPGNIPSLAPGDTSKIQTGLILGFGKVYINATVTCAEGATYSEEGTAIMLLFLAIGVSEPLP